MRFQDSLAGLRERVGAEADPALFEEPHHRDQLVQLAHRLGGAVGGFALLGDRQELRLPGLPAHPLAPHRLDRRLDRVRADRLHPVREVKARERHLQADDRRDQEVGLVDPAELGIQHRQRPVETGAVE